MKSAVGLGGVVGLASDVAVPAIVFGFGSGVQPARAAPAATVAVSFRNVRRERGVLSFMVISISNQHACYTANDCAQEVLYPIHPVHIIVDCILSMARVLTFMDYSCIDFTNRYPINYGIVVTSDEIHHKITTGNFMERNI
jgi:hypothetical protein